MPQKPSFVATLGSPITLGLVLTLCIARLWLMPLPSSFWVDEMVSAFVVHFGASHSSLAAAPQVTGTIYYWLPRAAESVFGFSEVAYRIPSLIVMGAALWLIAKLAARLIHPLAGWLAVFGCLALKGFNYEAADARPYALGTCIAAASLWFLIRWMDSARWRDALLFTICAALLWRVHLIFWPFYAIFGLYAAVRLLRRDTAVDWKQISVAAGLLALSLAPVALQAIALARQAHEHVIVDLPVLRDLRRTLKFLLIAQFAAGAIVACLLSPSRRDSPLPPVSAWVLILGWWLVHPLALFAFSLLTGNSVYVDRYLSLALPGAALTATLVAAMFLPSRWWHPAATIVGVAILMLLGQWKTAWPVHHNSNWREAARAVNELSLGPSTPVLLPSPFIEARAPVWRPDYQLPGFLYSYLLVYKVAGTPYLLPFERSKEAERYAAELAPTLAGMPRFIIYGGDGNVFRWLRYFASRPELRGWSNRRFKIFGDVDVAVFDNPASPAAFAKLAYVQIR